MQFSGFYIGVLDWFVLYRFYVIKTHVSFAHGYTISFDVGHTVIGICASHVLRLAIGSNALE